MPYYRKKICASPNCKNYAESGSAWCKDHKPNRGTTSKHPEWYKSSWFVHNRREFLIKPENHYCASCAERGEIKIANTVHHSCGYNSWETFCDMSKWVAWCSGCHSSYHTKITNEELYNQSKEKGLW